MRTTLRCRARTDATAASRVVALVALVALAAPAPAAGQSAPPDPGWPRVFKDKGATLTVYQPQVDAWKDYRHLHFRCAIAVKGALAQERFGVVEIDADTATDHASRVVVVTPSRREVRFAGVSAEDLARLRQAVDRLAPPRQPTTLSIDRVVAYLDETTQRTQRAVEVNLDPPRIFHSSSPAILVMFMGAPQLAPVEPKRTDLEFAVNTNWDLLRDTASGRYYLLHGAGWLTAPDLLQGPWTPAAKLPSSLHALPADANWAEARKRLPGTAASAAPKVFVTTEPAELIVTTGAPAYRRIRETRLQQVTNTKSVLFRDESDGKLYFLVAGRWFRGERLAGPWSAASKDLPPDFARIPYDDPAAVVKASVPGTREAKDALLLASIPTATTVDVGSANVVQVRYEGAPSWAPIEGTSVQAAVNSSPTVFLAGGSFYTCDQGVWFCSANATGPWSFCTSVPSSIYAIPAASPYHNVTYVVVQSSTPTTVTYSQTSGYSGEYVAVTGVVMFGAGMAIGAAMASGPHYYYPPPPYYSYGCGASYHYGYGGYYSAGYRAYGPYGGVGYTAGYSPATGTYGRSATAYGPYGSATRAAAYNPYTGRSAAGAQVNTAYGSARRGAAYDAQTGARAGGSQVSTAYGSAGRGAAYNPSTGNAAAGGYRTSAYGSAGAVRTNQGTGAATWNTANGQGAVSKTRSGDVYASNGDTVYKKDSSGNWSSNSGGGWQSASQPPPRAGASSGAGSAQTQGASAAPQGQRASSASGTPTASGRSMESEAQARQWGSQQSQRTSQSGSMGSGARSSGGGRSGGRRR